MFIPDNVFGNITPPIPSFSEVKISLVEFDKVDPFSLERGEAASVGKARRRREARFVS